MEFEKSEPDVINRLYALRGGLSALSVKYDQTRKIDENFYEKLHTVADTAGGARHEAPQGTVEYANWLVGYGFESELNDRYNSIKQLETPDYSYEYKEDIQTNRKHSAKNIKIAVLTLTIIICLVAFGGILFGGKALEGPMDYVTLIALLLIPLILIIIALKKSRRVARKKQELKNYTDSLNQRRESEKRIYESKRNIAQSNIDQLPQVRKEAQKILDERNRIINPLVKYCNEYYKALLQEFNPLLDERDWKNLDLVIYELETRRADSIKEALQLVDRELQTERIERTIGEATKAICYTVARGFTELQSTVKICCDRICDKLDDISLQLDNVMTLQAIQSIQLAGISGQLADLTDSVNVGNALQAKAHETSAQLCNDVHALRYYN